jgi:hypothetical protein
MELNREQLIDLLLRERDAVRENYYGVVMSDFTKIIAGFTMVNIVLLFSTFSDAILWKIFVFIFGILPLGYIMKKLYDGYKRHKFNRDFYDSIFRNGVNELVYLLTKYNKKTIKGIKTVDWIYTKYYELNRLQRIIKYEKEISDKELHNKLLKNWIALIKTGKKPEEKTKSNKEKDEFKIKKLESFFKELWKITKEIKT